MVLGLMVGAKVDDYVERTEPGEFRVVEADGERSLWRARADARPFPDRDFIQAVRGGPDRIRVPWAEAYRTHRLACALTRSADEGRPVALGEVATGG